VALLVEDHHRDTRDRFAHRVDAEDRVLRHRYFSFDVLHAVSLELDHLAASGDDRHRTGEVMRHEVPLDEVVDPGEAGAGHADVFRRGEGEALRTDCGANSKDDRDAGKCPSPAKCPASSARHAND